MIGRLLGKRIRFERAATFSLVLIWCGLLQLILVARRNKFLRPNGRRLFQIRKIFPGGVTRYMPPGGWLTYYCAWCRRGAPSRFELMICGFLSDICLDKASS
ncbi:uncharacterized protein PHALS_11728 [Plasmopara halstedii]|uniref:Uncharacterized protein n=1 Tax=Plasmopara halstedii TaxID=4781 RepID=A0A0P1AKH3_PLAHL|nr:uncharacterized protein PHALS_11728 [Plasmopara halstedii]CEG41378.1 hypothetical protein PHALS_11728 [Plasmopara halstedii]|eukprot:XP_024577747.1 hypothetical protein PHALS_11728 [Plasmopara halstedii]